MNWEQFGQRVGDRSDVGAPNTEKTWMVTHDVMFCRTSGGGVEGPFACVTPRRTTRAGPTREAVPRPVRLYINEASAAATPPTNSASKIPSRSNGYMLASLAVLARRLCRPLLSHSHSDAFFRPSTKMILRYGVPRRRQTLHSRSITCHDRPTLLLS
ncbi:unnamed protein product [Caenorhabditis auriculariae]|uniref:Uncharacterized protein n=1 Tax=Caenorhabditis auriculariae TaxID=2777116 RepID=A0A8S1H8M5_9PELO|nr:unnamed protein product [Caenorhabditis auriculariae]